MKLYHVDRSNELQENQIIQLNKVFFKSDTELCNLFDSLFPNGISRHGELYLNDFFTFPPNEYPIFCLKDDLEKMGIHVSENLLELYRRANFPEIPSRFTSMFALKNIDDLKYWPELTKNNFKIFEINYDGPIYQLDASFIKGAICHLNDNKNAKIGFYPALIFKEFHQYLSGHFSNNPKPEILLPLPITIGKEIYL